MTNKQKIEALEKGIKSSVTPENLKEKMRTQLAQLKALEKESTSDKKPKFKVGDVVANTRSQNVGIVLDVFESGDDLRTDADGVVSISELQIYDKKKHSSFHIAPSIKEKLETSNELKVGQKYKTKKGDILTIKDFDVENHVTTDDGKGNVSSQSITRISMFKELIKDGELVLVSDNKTQQKNTFNGASNEFSKKVFELYSKKKSTYLSFYEKEKIVNMIESNKKDLIYYPNDDRKLQEYLGDIFADGEDFSESQVLNIQKELLELGYNVDIINLSTGPNTRILDPNGNSSWYIFNLRPKQLEKPKRIKSSSATPIKKASKNYYRNKEVKSVTVLENGKKVTYAGKDVLNGANFFKEGGVLTSKATYIPVRNIVEVTFEDGSKDKPRNGYHIKNGATPIMENGGEVEGYKLVYQKWSKMMGGNGVSGTIRTAPQNYYVADIDENGNISFSDIESKTKNIDKIKVEKLWKENKIPTWDKYENGGVVNYEKGKTYPVKKVSVAEGEKIGLDGFPNFHKSGSISGMKKQYYGKDALLIQSGNYIYNVTSEPEIYFRYEHGGVLDYDGKTAKQVWDNWSKKQREHFLADHYDVIEPSDLGAKDSEYEDLDFLTQSQIELHISQGQYEHGGQIELPEGSFIHYQNYYLEHGGNIDKNPVELKGYRVNFYKSHDKNGSNIVSDGQFKDMILVTDGKSGDSFSVMSNEPHLMLVERTIFGKKYLHVTPVNVKAPNSGRMFGGNFVWSSDSRFRENVSDLPLPLHDRVEVYEKGGELKKRLSKEERKELKEILNQNSETKNNAWVIDESKYDKESNKFTVEIDDEAFVKEFDTESEAYAFIFNYYGIEAPKEYKLGGALLSAWKRERKYVNKSEDYEVRYAKGKNRSGYKKIAKGGEVKTSVDLFENYELQPENLQEIVSNYNNKAEEGELDYEDMLNFQKEVEAIGYTFDYGLDNEPFGLRPIGTELEEDDEENGYFAKGGEVGDYAKVPVGYNMTHYGLIKKVITNDVLYPENGYEIAGIGDILHPEQFEVISSAEFNKLKKQGTEVKPNHFLIIEENPKNIHQPIQKISLGDAVIYKEEVWYFSKKGDVLGLKNMKQGAWGSNFPFVPLDKINVTEEIKDSYGRKIKNINVFEEKLEKGGVLSKGDEVYIFELRKTAKVISIKELNDFEDEIVVELADGTKKDLRSSEVMKAVKPKVNPPYDSNSGLTLEERKAKHNIQNYGKGGATEKGQGKGAIFAIAKEIRKPGEKWQDAVARAGKLNK